jgi:hypothetical protein
MNGDPGRRRCALHMPSSQRRHDGFVLLVPHSIKRRPTGAHDKLEEMGSNPRLVTRNAGAKRDSRCMRALRKARLFVQVGIVEYSANMRTTLHKLCSRGAL